MHIANGLAVVPFLDMSGTIMPGQPTRAVPATALGDMLAALASDGGPPILASQTAHGHVTLVVAKWAGKHELNGPRSVELLLSKLIGPMSEPFHKLWKEGLIICDPLPRRWPRQLEAAWDDIQLASDSSSNLLRGVLTFHSK
jgi:hypothetical protein